MNPYWGPRMDEEAYGIARVVSSLYVCHEELTKALSGAQIAHDNPLFGRLFKKQNEIRELLRELVSCTK